MKAKNSTLIALSTTVIFVCTVIGFAAYSYLASWADYDPKEAAIDKVTQCLDAEEPEQEEVCGLMIMRIPCWNAIEESVDTLNNPYSVEVLWYNWEDQIPSRGGDEVYLQVTFADGKVFRVLWYESVLESCEVAQ